MSRNEYKLYTQLRELLQWCYTIPDRDLRVRSVANVQTRLANMVTQ